MRRHPLPLLDIGRSHGRLERFVLAVSLWGGITACGPAPNGDRDLSDLSLAVPVSVGQGLTPEECEDQGYNVILGTEGDDTLNGTNRADCIFGLGGNDVIQGGRGDDLIYGGAGDDVLRGGRGNDSLFGEAGDDDLDGEEDDDHLSGGYGNDSFSTDRRDADTVDGGFGVDNCSGPGCEPYWLGVYPIVATPSSHRPVRRDELPAWPEGWYSSSGDVSSDASAGPLDLTGVASAYPSIDGEEYLALRFQLGDPADDVADRVGLISYLDGNHDGTWDARIASVRVENLGGSTTGTAVVTQAWTGNAWGPLTLHGWTDSSDDAVGARGRDDPACGGDSACQGWLFDGDAELAPSHAPPERSGVVSLTVPLADLGFASGTRPQLWTGVYDAEDSLEGTELNELARILVSAYSSDCNDPLRPITYLFFCTTASNVPWADYTDQAVQTPATLEELTPRDDGFSAVVTAVRGPTWLELWHLEENEARFTGTRLHVTTTGPVTLTDPAGARGPYFLVDRGIDGIAAVFDAQGPLDAAERPRGLEGRPHALPTGESAPVAAGYGALAVPSIGLASVPARNPPGQKLSAWLVDVPREGGIVVLPAETAEGPVAALWVEGNRAPAWPCGSDRACALVSPPEASRRPPWRRAGLVEVGDAVTLEAPPEVAPGARPATLRTRHRVAHPQSWSGWNAPLEHLEALGYTFRPWLEEATASLANTGEGALLAFEAKAISWHANPSLEHAVSLHAGDEALGEVRFFGREGTIRVERPRDASFTPASLSLRHVEGAGAGEEALLFLDGVVERDRAPVVGAEPLLARVDQGAALHLEANAESLFVVVRGPNGERAFVVAPGQPFTVATGDLVAATTTTQLAARAPASLTAAATATSAFGKDTVVVLGAGASDLAAAKAAIAPWLAARDPDGTRIAVLSSLALQASFLRPTSEADAISALLRGMKLSYLDGGVVTALLVGAANERTSEVQADGGLFVASALTFTNGYNAMSDARLARTAQGAPLERVVVARLPVENLADLESAAARLAEEALRERPLDRLAALGDSHDDFGLEVEAAATHAATRGLLAHAFDGYTLGATEARAGALDVLEQGSPLLWLVGHGSPRGFGSGLVTGATLDTFYRDRTEETGAVVVGLTCLVGHLSIPGETNRMGARLFSDDNARVRTAIVGAGFLDATTHDRFGEALLDTLTGEGATAGGAYLAARGRALEAGASRAALDAYALLGDPFARVGQ